jgi:hypothetical protein
LLVGVIAVGLVLLRRSRRQTAAASVTVSAAQSPTDWSQPGGTPSEAFRLPAPPRDDTPDSPWAPAPPESPAADETTPQTEPPPPPGDETPPQP